MTKDAEMPVRYHKYRAGRWEVVDGRVIQEAPVSLTVNGDAWLTFMCTPTELEALAVGFLFNEGFIQEAAEIVDVTVCASGDNVDVWLTHGLEKPSVWRRTTGCSGGLTAAEPVPTAIAVPEEELIEPKQICALMDQLFESQELYRSSHGVHASVLTDGDHAWVHAEDIGRHNTLDKVAGLLLLKKLDPPRRILLTTGRISSEMLQKSSRMGASLVISRTAPNASSIRAAEQVGITLIGYARRDQFQVYTHAERIKNAPEPVSPPPELHQAY